ncbi:MAG TPA: acetyl-CoA carboxylase biotin carboxyl carrier protein [Candidatus Acidoferrum sp.]|nr:acetyl-CoA carboxylase biotin carboxyl carrier protein [Candidatus Acidoferrum sp.]
MRPRRARPDDPQALTDLVRKLGALLSELNLSEIEVNHGETRIRLSRTPPASPIAVTTSPPPPAPVADALSFAGITIESPMVGTFYGASAPTAEPYVREGDLVKEGQILCIIEAMKLMNEIETRAAGRIAKILVDNGQAVEYGQPLFLIEPPR